MTTKHKFNAHCCCCCYGQLKDNLIAGLSLQTVLIHSSSRVVLALLKKATENRSRLKIFITASARDDSGYALVCTTLQCGNRLSPVKRKKMKAWLEAASIKSKVILDSAVG